MMYGIPPKRVVAGNVSIDAKYQFKTSAQSESYYTTYTIIIGQKVVPNVFHNVSTP
jgi:hypothetical protein